MIGTWSFRNVDTGHFTGATYCGDIAHLKGNTPEGCEAVEGLHAMTAPTSETARMRRSRVLQQIKALELQQLRPLRELAVDPDNPIARERLTSLDAQIAALRELL